MWIVLRTGHVTATPGPARGVPVTAALDEVAAGGAPEVDAVTVPGTTTVSAPRPGPGAPGTQVQVVLDEAPGEARTPRVLRALALAGSLGLVLTAAPASGRAPRRPAAAARRSRCSGGSSPTPATSCAHPLTLLSTRAQMLRRKLARPGAACGPRRRPASSPTRDRLAAILDDLLLAADPRAPDPTRTSTSPRSSRRCSPPPAPAAAARASRLDLEVDGEVGSTARRRDCAGR